jgi:hypothetical protein
VKCLEDHYVVQLGSYPALKDNGFWVEDNAPSHNSRFTNAWKDKHWPIHDVRWPPDSRDLNPLDYSIWSQIEGLLQPSYPSKAALKAGRPIELSADALVARPTDTGAPVGTPALRPSPPPRPAARPPDRLAPEAAIVDAVSFFNQDDGGWTDVDAALRAWPNRLQAVAEADGGHVES